MLITLSRLLVSCRSLVDRFGSLGNCKPQIYFFYFLLICSDNSGLKSKQRLGTKIGGVIVHFCPQKSERQTLLSNGNFGLKSKHRLGTSDADHISNRKLAKWSFTSVCAQMNMRPAVGWQALALKGLRPELLCRCSVYVQTDDLLFLILHSTFCQAVQNITGIGRTTYFQKILYEIIIKNVFFRP